MFLMIDHYDSFVYNLVHLVEACQASIHVISYDRLQLSDIDHLQPEGIILSPGPKSPQEALKTQWIIQQYKTRIPILGVCLGHQTLAAAFGATIKKGLRPMHGKITAINHDGQGLFLGLPTSFHVTRYHSLIVDPISLPQELCICASSEDGAIMGIRHNRYPLYGIQFHPEAVLTEYGSDIILNFIHICRKDTYHV